MEGSLDQYWCYNCERPFKTFRSVVAHCNDEGHKRGYHCISCSKILTSEAKLAAHCASEHYKCTSCTNIFSSAENLKQHKEITHAIPCSFCGKLFKSQESLESHQEGVHNLKCAECELYFNTKDLKAIHDTQAHKVVYRKHLDIFKPLAAQVEHSHQLNHLQCRHCDLSFTKEDSLKIHHDLTHRIPCPYCKAIFLTQQYLNKHIGRDHHYQCGLCPEILRTYIAHTQHQAICKFDQEQDRMIEPELQVNKQDPVEVEVAQQKFVEFTQQDFVNSKQLKSTPALCEMCGGVFYDITVLRHHEVGCRVKMEKFNRENVEKMAKKSESQLPEVKQQEPIETEQPVYYPCRLCSQVFLTRNSRKEHEVECQLQREAAVQFDQEEETKVSPPEVVKTNQEPIAGQDQEVDLIEFEEHESTNLYFGDSIDFYKQAVQSYSQGPAEANHHSPEIEIQESIRYYSQLLDPHQFSEAEDEEPTGDGREECERLKAEERLAYIHIKDKHEKTLGSCQTCQAFFIHQLGHTTYDIGCPALLDGEPCTSVFKTPTDLINHVMEKHTGRCDKCLGVLFTNLPTLDHQNATFHTREANIAEPIVKIKEESYDKENNLATIQKRRDLNRVSEVVAINVQAQDVEHHTASLPLIPKSKLNGNAPVFVQASAVPVVNKDFGYHEEVSGGEKSATDAYSTTATVGHPAKEEEFDIFGPIDLENDAILFPVLLPSS